MLNAKNIIVFVLTVVVFGMLMAYQANAPFGWQKAATAALAFGALGWPLNRFAARRK